PIRKLDVYLPVDAGDPGFLDEHAPGQERASHLFLDADRAVGQQRHIAPFGEQLCLVHGHWPGGDDADPPVAEFVSVAIGTMKDGLAPAFGNPRDRWQLVGYTDSEKDASA